VRNRRDKNQDERFEPQAYSAEGKAKPEVVNIMAALKESMQAKGRAKVRDGMRKRMGKAVEEEEARQRTSRPDLARAGRHIEESQYPAEFSRFVVSCRPRSRSKSKFVDRRIGVITHINAPV
jgi:hypothetical protein